MKTNDVAKVEHWLKALGRVRNKTGDRRMVEVARALKYDDIAALLEQYEHVNEFACATFACDLARMMEIIALGQGFLSKTLPVRQFNKEQ